MRLKVCFLMILCVSIVVFRFWLIGNQNNVYKKIPQLLGAPEVMRTIPILSSSKETSFQAPSIKPTYYSIYNPNYFPILPHVVINNHDWSTVDSIMEEIFTNTASSSAEIAFSLWNFVSKNIYHAPSPAKGVTNDVLYTEVRNPPQMLNSWGYSYCGDTAAVLAQLGYLSGFPSRTVNVKNSHSATEFFYDNKWHLFDADRQVVYIDKGAVASYEEVRNNLRLISGTDHKLLAGYFGDIKNLQFEYFTATQSTMVYYDDTYPIVSDFPLELHAHDEIRFYYDWRDAYFWNSISDKPPVFTNGFLISPVSATGQLKGLIGKPYEIQLPYPIVGLFLLIPQCNLSKIFLSVENSQLSDIGDFSCSEEVVNLSEYIPKGTNTYPSHSLSILLPFILPNGFIITQFQVAPNSLPTITEGTNTISWGSSLVNVSIAY